MKNEKEKTFRLGVYLFSIMTFISSIGYALFPLSSMGYDGSIQSFIHVYILTTLIVLLSIISLILIIIGAYKSKYKLLSILVLVSLIFMFMGAVLSENVPKEIFGLVERFSTYSAVIYVGILGIFGFKKQVKI